ncbi:MAG: glycosyltransferase, partial [Candidatus Binatia bacterium]
ARADVAIVTAGATTLAELAAVGLPAIVVPLASAARDHQTPNARAFAVTTGAPWCREGDWDVERLAGHVVALAASPSSWAEAAAGMRRYARPDATEAVVGACLDALNLHPARAARAI